MTRPLRILHIASGDLWAGAEVQAFTLMCQLRQMPDTEVAAFLMNEGVLADKLRAVGVTVSVIEERSAGAARIFAGLRKFMNGWRPDVIHTHREKENILGSLANRCSRNVPCIRTMHGGREHSSASGWRGVRRWVVEGLDHWCGRTLQDRIVAVTRDLATQISGEYPRDSVVLIENGIDVAAVRAGNGVAEFRASGPEKVHVGIVGRLFPVKRVDLFVEMAGLLARDQSQQNWAFHVFGDGPLRLELENLSRRRGMEDRITFHGHRHDIARCIAGLDALVICSDHEGMPLTALEAAALEVPTVAHAVGGLVDIVPPEFLVVRHDAYGYQQGVLRALCEGASDIATRRAEEVLPRFSAKRNAERIRALYQQVIAEADAAVSRS